MLQKPPPSRPFFLWLTDINCHQEIKLDARTLLKYFLYYLGFQNDSGESKLLEDPKKNFRNTHNDYLFLKVSVRKSRNVEDFS